MLIGTEQAEQARQTFWESAFVGFHEGKGRFFFLKEKKEKKVVTEQKEQSNFRD
jgi:hypothetical protein